MSLIGLLEFTAACGFLFATGRDAPIWLYGFVFAILALWSLRIRNPTVRFAVCHWIASISGALFGIASLERAFRMADPTTYLMCLWVWCGFALLAAAPLAFLNGCLFSIEAWSQAKGRRRTG